MSSPGFLRSDMRKKDMKESLFIYRSEVARLARTVVDQSAIILDNRSDAISQLRDIEIELRKVKMERDILQRKLDMEREGQ